jgi:hypothetical protein
MLPEDSNQMEDPMSFEEESIDKKKMQSLSSFFTLNVAKKILFSATLDTVQMCLKNAKIV